jgi:hypothetical protein
MLLRRSSYLDLSCFEHESVWLSTILVNDFIILLTVSSYFCFLLDLFLVTKELYLFLIICSVRAFFNKATILDHLFPYSSTNLKIVKSYRAVHSPFIFESSKWFINLSLQCLGDLKVILSESMKIFLEISFQLPALTSLMAFRTN